MLKMFKKLRENLLLVDDFKIDLLSTNQSQKTIFWTSLLFFDLFVWMSEATIETSQVKCSKP